MLAVIGLAMLPVVGNLAGALLTEAIPRSERWRNQAMHAAVGVVFAIVAVEIMPEALAVLNGWQIATAFTVGGAIYLGIEWFTDRVSGGDSRMWMIYVAIASDLFGDGLLIGAGSSVAASLGVVLAVGQVLADIPEGAASALTYRSYGVDRRRRIWMSVSLALPAAAGAAVSYLALRNVSETIQLAALVATAGLFAVAVFEDMITEAHAAAADSRTSTASLLGGFALFVVVSTGLS